MESRTSASQRDTAPRAARGADDGDPAPDEALDWRPRTRGTGAPPRVSDGPDGRSTAAASSGRGRAVVAALIAALAAAVLYGVSTLGPVRTVLRQSFTRLSSPSMQFYLNGSPWVAGEFLNVPLGIILMDGPGAVSYQVHVWTVDGDGKQDASTTVALPVENGKGAVNFSLPIPADAQLVWAQVEGTSLSVHYRFAGSALATPSATR